MRKYKWFLALVLFICITTISTLEDRLKLPTSIGTYFTSGEDFVVMRKWVSSFINQDDEMTTVQHELLPVSQYESVQPFQEGLMISYTHPISVQANKNGLIIFTGITRKTGKTVTVLYDDGDEVTYGFVGSFHKIPYTSVKRGDTIAWLDEHTMFLKVKREGLYLETPDLLNYLTGMYE